MDNFTSQVLADLSFYTVMRILVAAIVGGAAMFIWTSIAHITLPLGEAGINEVPNESPVLNAMQSSMGRKTGLYIFPGLGVGEDATRTEKNETYEKNAGTNRCKPFWHSNVPSARTSVRIWEIARHRVRYRSVAGDTGHLAVSTDAHCQLCWRVGFVVVAGLLASITTNVSYWNCTVFPASILPVIC